MTKTQKIGTLQMLACSVLWSMAGIMFKYIPWHPVVIASVRAAAGACSAFDILPAVWVSSLCSVTAGLLAAAVLRRLWP